MENNTVTIDGVGFLKESAKGIKLSDFKKSHIAPAFSHIDLDKAYITLGGKKSTDKKSSEDKPSEDKGYSKDPKKGKDYKK